MGAQFYSHEKVWSARGRPTAESHDFGFADERTSFLHYLKSSNHFSCILHNYYRGCLSHVSKGFKRHLNSIVSIFKRLITSGQQWKSCTRKHDYYPGNMIPKNGWSRMELWITLLPQHDLVIVYIILLETEHDTRTLETWVHLFVRKKKKSHLRDVVECRHNHKRYTDGSNREDMSWLFPALTWSKNIYNRMNRPYTLAHLVKRKVLQII